MKKEKCFHVRQKIEYFIYKIYATKPAGSKNIWHVFPKNDDFTLICLKPEVFFFFYICGHWALIHFREAFATFSSLDFQ